MNRKKSTPDSFEALDKLAHQTETLRPLTPAMRRQWEAAKKTGRKFASLKKARALKAVGDEARIVPIFIEPSLLERADRFAKSAGLTRSRLVAEALRLRLNGERTSRPG